MSKDKKRMEKKVPNPFDVDIVFEWDSHAGRVSGKSNLGTLITDATVEVSFKGENQPYAQRLSNPFAFDLVGRTKQQNPPYRVEIVDTEFGDVRNVNRVF